MFMVIFNVKKLFAVVVVVACLLFGLVCGLAFGQSQLDTSIVSMSGVGWSLKVDESLATDSVKSAISVSSAKAGSEKEISVVLNSIDDVPDFQVQFKVATTGLSVYKQLPLDKELNISEYDFVNATVAMRKGQVIVSRPQGVVNSFACFDGAGRKVLHIFASKLIDAKGNSVWVDSDLKDGLLTVVLPKDWMEGASYPILLDPTFGLTTVGGSSQYFSADYVSGSKFTLSEAGTITQLEMYHDPGSSIARKLAVYNNSASKDLVCQSAESVDSGVGWVIYDVPDTGVAAGDYWLVYLAAAATVSDIRYDSAGNGGYVARDYDLGFPSDLSGWAAETKTWSIFANYTTAAPTSTPTSTPLASATPDGSGVTTGNTLGFVFFLVIFVLQIALIVTFVPALACAVALGKWGFFAGATCGIVMGYVWLGAGFVPVWCVLLVGLADFLMFYQGVKGSV